MKIKKIYQGELPENKILNAHNTSQTDTYSCDYINNLTDIKEGEWIDLTLVNNWVQGADTYNKPQYKKIGNRIDLRGFINNPNTLTADTRFSFYVSSELAPKKVNQFNLYASSSNFIGAYMHTSGGFRVSATYQAGENLSLDGIFYYLD